MKKNGFVSSSLIYTFFVIFLLLMILLLNSYSNVRFLLDEFKYDIRTTFASLSGSDINLYIMVYNDTLKDWEIKKEIPSYHYSYDPVNSYCTDPTSASINYINDSVSIVANKRATCYAYFEKNESDIELKIYTKANEDAEKVLVGDIPNSIYEYTSYNCKNGSTLNWDEENRKITISAYRKDVCEVVFTRMDMDIEINYYLESAGGNHEFNGVKYVKTSDTPDSMFKYSSYDCKNDSIVEYDETTKEIEVIATKKDVCNLYFSGISNRVELIIMQETETGISGFTTGKYYSRVYSIPSLNYTYVGYICDDSSAKVTYIDGVLDASSDVQTTCRVYFNAYSGTHAINYYLEKENGTYESVASVPSIGYEYNSEKSKCVNGSNITVEGTTVIIESEEFDTCNIYFDLMNADVKVLVYVLNRSTGEYVLGDVPTSGYTLSEASCTDGGSIKYENGSLYVESDTQTVCTVRFS